MTRPGPAPHPLTHAGGDVVLRWRAADGKAVFDYVDPRTGQPIDGRRGRAWAHELRGVGWGIAAIKAAIADLPLEGTSQKPAAPPVRAPEARPEGSRLHAHFALPEGDR